MGLVLRFVRKAGERLHEMLRELEARHGDDIEMQFWVRYIKWADLDSPLPASTCEAWLAEEPSRLIPAMYVCMISEGVQRREEAARLLAEFAGSRTARAHYVRSVLEQFFTDGEQPSTDD